MMELVAAQAENHVIGDGMKIPWRAKGEQRLFRDITLGGTLIMGRRTYDSIGRPLPGRHTIVLSRNPALAGGRVAEPRGRHATGDGCQGAEEAIPFLALAPSVDADGWTTGCALALPDCEFVLSLAAALARARALGRKTFVVGGGEVYREALPQCDGIHLTTVHTQARGDVTFPDFDPADFDLVQEERHESNINYTYRHYRRRAAQAGAA